ncbi:MAG: hypothetical protein IJN86_06885, partial [Clostridia bacterium]|nr:hypothetical protein [Clostridia bacterium]
MKYIKMKSLLAFLLCMAIIASLLTVNISAKENISYTEDELSGEQSKEECITIDDSTDADRYGLGDVIVFGDPAEDSSADQSEEESYIINEDNDEVSDSEISADASVSPEESEAEAGNESTTPDATDTANGKKPIDKNEKPQYNADDTDANEEAPSEDSDAPAENVNNNVVDKDYSTRALSGNITIDLQYAYAGGVVEAGTTCNITFKNSVSMAGPITIKGTLNMNVDASANVDYFGFIKTHVGDNGNTNFTGAMFIVEPGGTFTVTNNSTKYLYLDGGYNGVTGSNGGVVSPKGTVVQGPVIHIKGGTCTLDGVRVRQNYNNSTTLPGGGINIEGGTLNLNNAKIESTGCVGGEGRNGGGIYASGGTITVTGTRDNWIGPCEAYNGGGVYLGDDAEMNINSSYFTFGASSFVEYIKDDDDTDADWSDYRNKASNYGGAIYIDGGTLNIESMRIAGWNEATKGGAIYINNGTANINSSTTVVGTDSASGYSIYNGHIYRSMAEQGGAIYVASNGELNFQSGFIDKSGMSSRPNAPKPIDGAAIYIEDGGVATLSGGMVNNNEGKLKGGAIYIENGGTLNLSGDCTINNNKVAEKIGPVPGNIAPNATYKGTGSTNYYTDGDWKNYHSGKLTNNANDFKMANSVLFNGSSTLYIIFKFTEEVSVDKIQIYFGDTKNISTRPFLATYPSSVTAYMSTSESTATTNLTTANSFGSPNISGATPVTAGTYNCERKEYTFSASSGKTGTYLIFKITWANTDNIACSEVVINGYYTSEVQTETTYGGGIYNEGKVEMTGGTVSSNSAVEGGGVFNLGDFTMSGGTISSNTAANGGGIGAYGGTVNISGGTIKNNTATEDGGGIYFRNFTENTERDLTISGGTITGNKAGDDGGGVCARSNNESAVINFDYSGGTISQNQCTTGGGGGIILYGSGIKFNMSQADDNKPTVVSGNTNTANHGGGIWVGSVTSFKMSGGTITGNYLRTEKDKGGAGIFMNRAIKETVEITGGTISSNYNARYGGGIYIGDEKTNLDDEGGQFASLNVEITDCDIHSNSAEQGGGIYVQSSDNYYPLTLTVGDGVTIRNNNATCSGNGGGAGITARNATVTLGAAGTDGPSITENGGDQGNQGNAAWDGGAIYCYDSDLYIYSGEISENRGCHGAVYLVGSDSKGSVGRMEGGKIINNSEGGVFLNGINATLILTDGEISNNTLGETGKVQGQQNYGGAGVCCYNGGKLQMSGGKITGNVNYNTAVDNAGENFDSKHHGGGIAVVKNGANSNIASLVITGGEISGNTSTNGAGGGIFIEEGGSLTISEGVTISGNKAQNGAGIYSRSEDSYISTITINGGTISGNEAVTSGGGMYVNGNVNLTVNGGTFTDNKAPGYGGGAICI